MPEINPVSENNQMPQINQAQYDVAIIGGSYAGLAAALPLGRARRNVLVIDHSQRRNRFAEHSHGFLTQDGSKAADIAVIAKQQLAQYSTVEWQDGQVERIKRSDDQIHICIDGKRAISAKRLIIATGIVDQLPEITGLQQRWGKSIFHCPYCHGYELNQGRIGVIYSSPLSLHLAQMLPDWGDTTLLLNGQQLNEAEQQQLQARGVMIQAGLVEQITGHADVVLQDGQLCTFAGLFVSTTMQIQQDWIRDLGLEFEKNDMGEIIKTDAMKQTTVANIFACGDIARFGGSVTFAVADGNMAGVATHRSLIFNH